MKYCQLCWLCEAALAAYSSDTLPSPPTIMNRDNAGDGDNGEDDDGVIDMSKEKFLFCYLRIIKICLW